ncbi:hypothetical protein THAOC_32345 [Thalassiosira oceanica]|uniref:Uncharacterized protein n=1 Tax=Thalassiosira oceanica TaxID=159749 RepID=K0RIU1_THAOC|nr:hypothetical protein THAOC_32345 [Thalassiosira oceanica]|eukprot:EJK48831.1 hypothetical protein THAOC_32345 [Thalassiosira oceanica]
MLAYSYLIGKLVEASLLGPGFRRLSPPWAYFPPSDEFDSIGLCRKSINGTHASLTLPGRPAESLSPTSAVQYTRGVGGVGAYAGGILSGQNVIACECTSGLRCPRRNQRRRHDGESNAMDDYDEYHPKSSEELGWVGHFAKKSTHLEEFGLSGSDDEIFSNCSKQSVDQGDSLLTVGLGAIFPRMASLQFLNINENLIGGGVDDTVETLVRGLVECKHLHTLFMQNNYITDSGLEMLIRGLPTSVRSLYLHGNQIALARQLPLLRFKELELSDNPLSPGAPQVVAASLVNPECCRLIGMELYDTNIGDEGATILAESLRSNRRVVKMRLALYSSNNTNITEAGWNAFLPSLYNTASINDTHGSNHTLRNVGFIPRNISQGVQTMLNLNSDQNKSRVAATKILQAHRHLDMKPILSRRLDLLPYVAMWLERFAEYQLDLKLTLIFDFVRAMPMDVVHGVVGKKKGKKRYRNGT